MQNTHNKTPKRLAIITGASRGIGKATAQLFLEAGFHVINLSRSPCDLMVENLSVDFTQPGCLDRVQDTLTLRLKEADQVVVIHNAFYYGGSNRVDQFDVAELNKEWQANFLSIVELNRFCIPHMRKSSSILYVGSTLSEKAVAGCFSYITFKHMLVGLMRATCQDLVGKFIHTACICPGFTETEMLMEHLGGRQEALESVYAMVSERRLIQPSEIASVLYYAANHSVINGSVIQASLGQIQK